MLFLCYPPPLKVLMSILETDKNIVFKDVPQIFLSIISMRICANVTGSVPSSVRTNLLLQSIHPVLCRMRSLFRLVSSQFSPLFMLIHLIKDPLDLCPLTYQTKQLIILKEMKQNSNVERFLSFGDMTILI